MQTEVSVSPRTVTPAQALDPWSHPPFQLEVPAAHHELDHAAGRGQQGATIHTTLPDLGTSTLSEQRESVTPVPYGSTHLRVTVFPDVTAAGKLQGG